MKRVMFLTLVLVLLGTAGTAFADPQHVDTQPQGVILGEVWEFYANFGEPGLRVDAYLYRPATSCWDTDLQEWVIAPCWDYDDEVWTTFGWPFGDAPAYGTWWWDPIAAPEDPDIYTDNASQQRRMNLSGHAIDPDDPDPVYLFTDVFGWYYAEFMMPRDEVWFPCGFPLKWKCNYALGPTTVEYHSPVDLISVMDWPWDDPDTAVEEDPQDTVSPLQVYLIDEDGGGYIIDFEVTGMAWLISDIN